MHPQQPPKKRRIWPWIFGAVLVLVVSIVVGALVRQPSAPPGRPAGDMTSTAATPTPPSSPMPVPTVAMVGSWTMPNLVGANLQEAQDAIQALTGNAIFFTKSHDATGAGRHQILDRDWKVCSQNVPPGTKITADTAIDFGAAKLDERC
jgi:PASTA domain-containing protein